MTSANPGRRATGLQPVLDQYSTALADQALALPPPQARSTISAWAYQGRKATAAARARKVRRLRPFTACLTGGLGFE